MTSINDFSQFASLRADASRGENSALYEVAEQFEALFVQNMLKSMRDASFGDPIFGDAGGGGLFRDMFDQQIATDIANGNGIGLADLLVRQMGGDSAPSKRAELTIAPATRVRRTAAVADTPTRWEDGQQFVADILPFAKRAARALGVSPLAVVSQAALETGWGKYVMPDADGNNSLNLFGIKATGDWHGPAVRRQTIEFEAGVAEKHQEPFRIYESLRDTFADYTRLLGDSHRYREVRGQANDVGGFADALQSAGYATDPRYAQKIRDVAGGEKMRSVLQALKETDLLSLSLNVR